METKDEEFSIIQQGGGKDDTSGNENNNNDDDDDNNNNNNNNNNSNSQNNNFHEGRYSKGTGVRKREETAEERDERRRKYFQQYIYQQNYQEALRSLLWEPYDCRDGTDSWYFGAQSSKVPKRKSISSSESSLSSSSSSYSSIDDILTVEVTQRCALNENKYSLERCEMTTNKRTSLTVDKGRRRGIRSVEGEDECTLGAESGRTKEEVNVCNDLVRARCATDPVQKLMNIEIMVSDLHTQNGSGFSKCMEHCEALPSNGKAILASASQCKLGSCEGGSTVCARVDNALNSVGKMLVTVEGTLEPRDSSENTQLVSPDTSLDVADGPVNVTAHGPDESGPSGSNVSVVSCYRAVPVAVVSTVPMIKCLNTQENVSNVNIIQTGSNPGGKYPRQQAKRIQPRVNTTPVPSTSKSRPKIQKSENRRCGTLDDKKAAQASKPERERPKSTNVCLNLSGLVAQPSRVHERGASVLTNHNRSVSNPVLGNQSAQTPNRFGSQQNIPVRLETHFGPTSPDGSERSQMFVTSRGQENHANEVNTVVVQGGEAEAPKPSPRTFISTEAQTDDVPLGISLRSNREQRRRERRERRHQRRLHQSVLNSGSVWQTNVDNVPRDGRGLPDILNSHMPPPYSAVSMPPLQQPLHLSPHGIPVPPGPQPVPHLIESPPGSPPSHQGGVRFPFPFPGSGRRSRGQLYSHEEETPKSCCGVVVTQTVSIRWFIVMIAFVGICCVIVGTVLGAMKASGREHLTVSLLMIGVGIVLVTVSGVAWRLTSQDAPSCRSMLGLGSGQDSATEPNRRFVPRMPPSYGRPHHSYAAMMYPEFQYRPPPPSYQASMQEYRLRLLLLERTNGNAAGLQTAMSPPPPYRSHAGSALGLRAPPLCRSLPQSEYSHPPSYRSRTSSTRPTLDPNGGLLGSVNHSRDPSLISHVSDQNGNVTQAVVNVISVMGNTVDLHQGETDIQMDSIKLGVDEDVPIPPLRMLLNKGKRSPTSSSDETKSENVNLVTIVTVSDNNTTTARDHTVESDVLAHL